MTLPRMTISLDYKMAAWMQNELRNGRYEPEDNAEGAALGDTMVRLASIVQDFEMMARATLLDENEHFQVYEDPDEGDETTVMVFEKDVGVLHVASPFWEPEMDEIEDWLVNHVHG